MIYIIGVVISAVVVALDRFTKILAVKYEVDKVIINKLLKFNLTYNTGSAFSFLGNKSWAQTFFIVITVIVLAFILALSVYSFVRYCSANLKKVEEGNKKAVLNAMLFGKEKKPHSFLLIAIPLVFGGALGNLIDRVANRKVVDFIFVFYETDIFPAIFNVADIALVVGMIMLVVYFLFLDKEAVFKAKGKKACENIDVASGFSCEENNETNETFEKIESGNEQ